MDMCLVELDETPHPPGMSGMYQKVRIAIRDSVEHMRHKSDPMELDNTASHTAGEQDEHWEDIQAVGYSK